MKPEVDCAETVAESPGFFSVLSAALSLFLLPCNEHVECKFLLKDSFNDIFFGDDINEELHDLNVHGAGTRNNIQLCMPINRV